MEQLFELLVQAIQALITAIIAFLLVALTLIARALQAVFMLAQPALLFGSACALGFGVYKFFPTMLAHYGGDFFAVLLALALTTIVPASLIMLAADTAGLWPVLWASAGLLMLAHFVIDRAPPLVLALLPVLALAGCILHFAFGDIGQPIQTEIKESTNEQEREWFGATVANNDSLDSLHSEPECALDSKHITG